MSGPREVGDPHPLLDRRPDAYFTGDIGPLLDDVVRGRIVVLQWHRDVATVEFRETDGVGVAEWGTASTLEDALRYALGAYLD